jgi:hypothetical protein
LNDARPLRSSSIASRKDFGKATLLRHTKIISLHVAVVMNPTAVSYALSISPRLLPCLKEARLDVKDLACYDGDALGWLGVDPSLDLVIGTSTESLKALYWSNREPSSPLRICYPREFGFTNETYGGSVIAFESAFDDTYILTCDNIRLLLYKSADDKDLLNRFVSLISFAQQMLFSTKPGRKAVIYGIGCPAPRDYFYKAWKDGLVIKPRPDIDGDEQECQNQVSRFLFMLFPKLLASDGSQPITFKTRAEGKDLYDKYKMHGVEGLL